MAKKPKPRSAHAWCRVSDAEAKLTNAAADLALARAWADYAERYPEAKPW